MPLNSIKEQIKQLQQEKEIIENKIELLKTEKKNRTRRIKELQEK